MLIHAAADGRMDWFAGGAELAARVLQPVDSEHLVAGVRPSRVESANASTPDSFADG